MKTSRFLAVGLLAGSPALAQSAQYLDFRTPAAAITLRVTDDNIEGPDLQLGFEDDSVRGRAFGRPVNLTLNDDRVGGIYGQSPVDLKVKEENDVLKARGTFGGQLTDFTVSPKGITGTVGQCSYQLTAVQGDRYQGSRSCGRGVENPVTLSIPPDLADDDEELAATLALVLAR